MFQFSRYGLSVALLLSTLFIVHAQAPALVNSDELVKKIQDELSGLFPPDIFPLECLLASGKGFL
jgi:hypothetical protein